MRLLGGPTRVALAFSFLLGGCDKDSITLPGNTTVPPGSLDGGYADPNAIQVGDSVANLDPTKDTDGDGVLDVEEGSVDTNRNGVPALLDPNESPSPNPPASTTGDSNGMNDAGTMVEQDSGSKYDGACDVLESESQFERAPVDVIWAIDNSGSMADDFLNVANGLQAFTNSVASSGANMHVVMVSLFVVGLDASIQNDPNYDLRAVNVQSTDAFRQLLNDFPNYEGDLRPDAATHIIVVTDDTSDMAHTEFKMKMEGKLGHSFYFHAITANQGIGLGPYGTAYTDLAAETGGQSQPISGDWNVIFDQLQSAIVETAELPCDIPVSQAEGRDLDKVQVLYTPTDGTQSSFPKAEDADHCGDAANAWYYDDNDAPTQIILCPATCESVKVGGGLDVVFACEPPPVLILN